jgi:hypothetical protein
LPEAPSRDGAAAHFIVETLALALILCAFVARALTNGDGVLTFFGFMMLFAVPFVVGSGFAKMVTWRFRSLPRLGLAELVVFEWAFGVGALFTVSTLLSALGVFSPADLLALTLLLVPLVIFGRPYANLETSVRRRDVPFLLGAVAMAVLAALYLRSGTPFPYATEWDPFQDAFIANRILYLGEFHVLTSSYSPLVFQIGDVRALPLLEALGALASGGSVVGIDWWGTYFLSCALSVAVYVLARQIDLPRPTAFLASVAAAWFVELGGESGLPVFRTAALLMTLAPFVYTSLLKGRRAGVLASLATLGLFALFISAEDTAFMAAVAIGALVFSKLSSRPAHRALLGLLALTLAGALVAISYHSFWPNLLPHLDLFSTRYSSLAIYYDPLVALQFLTYTFTYYGYLVALAGMLCFSALMIFWAGRAKLGAVAALTSASLVLYFLPISYSTRVVVYAHPLVAIMFAALLTLPVYAFFHPFRSGGGRVLKSITLLLVILIAIVAILPGSISTVDSRIEAQSPLGLSSFANYDYAMGNWLRDSAPANATLVGAPGDQQIQMGLSYRLSMGGNYMSILLQKEVKAALSTGNASVSSCAIRHLVGNASTPVFIFSGRTVYWMQKPNYFNAVFYPVTLGAWPSWASQFNDTTYYKLAHEVGHQIYAYYLSSSTCAAAANQKVHLLLPVEYTPGQGSVGMPTISNATSGMEISIPAGNFVESGIASATLSLDLSGLTGLNVTLQGTGDGGRVTIYVWAPDPQDLFKYQMADNFTGTRQLTIPLYQFTAAKGSPSWGTVGKVIVTWRTGGTRAVPAIDFFYSPPGG